MAEFRMPSLGADMDEGTVVQWKVKPGDSVKRGDIVAVVETKKAAIEIEIFQGGTVDEILVPEGTKVPVGTALARLRADGEIEQPVPVTPLIAPGMAAPPPVPTAAPSAPPPSPVAAAQPPAAGGPRIRVSPLARRLAAELGVDLATVSGSGIGGAISRTDVERAVSKVVAAGPGPPPAQVEAAAARQLAMREAIGALMARSKREIPHYYLRTTIDLSAALAWLETENLRRAVADRLIPSVLLIKAVALAAREVPEMNGFWVEGRFRASEAIHVGVAVSLRQGGLIAPAIHDVDRMALDHLMPALRDLVNRARGGMLRGSEMSDPTITVTNLGDQGADVVYGVIYAPQVALVGFGRIVERPWAREGMIGVHRVVDATLAADHRASDGHRGGRFLAAVERWLQKPENL